MKLCNIFIVIAYLLEVISAKEISSEGRIISGQPAVYGQFPWHVAMHYTNTGRTSFCGAALISDQWILTAAHCTQGALNFTMKMGGLKLMQAEEEGRVSIPATEYHVHPDYNANVHNDLTLVKMDYPVDFNDRIKAIKLPARGQTLEAGRAVLVSGYGRTSDASPNVSEVLNFVQLTSISNKECQDIYGNGIVIDSTVCCRGNPEHSTCNGDSGGPLVTLGDDGEYVYMGVISWVHVDGCGSGNPSGYVRTEAFLDWINEVTGLDV